MFTAEHLKFSPPALALVLINSFNLMIKHGIAPDDFGNSNTVPIQKSIQNFGKALSVDDFRGIFYLSSNFEGVQPMCFDSFF